MRSLGENYLSSLVFDAEQAKTLRSIGECRGKQELYYKQSPEALKSLKELAVIESTESSNRLEGIVVPHERIEALVLKKAVPRNRSEQEVAGYKDALDLIHQSGRHMGFTTNVILQLHSMIYRYMPSPGGRWKSTDNEIVERNPDGTVIRVRFKPTPAHLTSFQMEELTKRYETAIESGKQDPLIVIPLAILDFYAFTHFEMETAE